MSKLMRILPGLIVWLLLLSGATGSLAQAPLKVSEREQRPVYSFGVVPQFEQRKIFRVWRPILDDLEARTGFSFRLIGMPKIPAFSKKLMEGGFDFAYTNPYHIVQGADSQGYIPLVRDSDRTLTGVVVVAKDSPIRSVSELHGKEIAFPSPNALGASLVPRAYFAKSNISVIPKYVQTHSSVYLHVAQNLMIAGCGVASTLESQDELIRNKIRVLYRADGLPTHPVAAHPRVPAVDRARVQEELLAMADDPAGRALLAKIPMKNVMPASLQDYDTLKKLGLEAFYIDQ